MAAKKSRWYRPTFRKVMLLSGAIVLILLGVRAFLPRKTKEFPRPPVPKPFPDCPKVETKSYSWEGLSFEYPAGWEPDPGSSDENRKDEPFLQVFPGRGEDRGGTFAGVKIGDRSNSRAIPVVVKAAWDLPEGELSVGELLDPLGYEMLGPTTVPETIQRLKVSGYKALLSLDRGMGLAARENDAWQLLISDRGRHYHIGSGWMYNPYKWTEDGRIRLDEGTVRHNEELACGYWTIVKSLKLP